MIDNIIQENLRLRFNPEGSALRKHQLIMLDMLLYIDKVCKDNNIEYWLDSGSLIGAVRHGGFIPWDDDLDVMMTKDNYKKFIKVCPETDDYVLQTRFNDHCYPYPFPKLRHKKSILSEHGLDEHYKYRGIYVDIFYIEKTHKLVSGFLGRLRWLMERYFRKKKDTKWIVPFSSICIKVFFAFAQTIGLLSAFIPGRKYRHALGCSGWTHNDRRMEDIIPINTVDFEGYKIPCPNNPDSYLSKIYGNYLQLPDVSKLKPHIDDIQFL